MHIVYQLNYQDNTYYIGVTNNLKRRLYEHRYSENTKDYIGVHIIKECENEEDAYILEKVLVPDHSLRSPLLRNKTRGGRHPYNMRTGIPHTDETKKKIAKSRRGKIPRYLPGQKEEIRLKCIGENNHFYGKHHTDETKRKLHLANSGRPGSMKGKNLPDAAIKKISYEISTPDGIFLSSVRAAHHFNISQQTVINRCNSNNFPDWEILSKGSKYQEGV